MDISQLVVQLFPTKSDERLMCSCFSTLILSNELFSGLIQVVTSMQKTQPSMHFHE